MKTHQSDSSTSTGSLPRMFMVVLAAGLVLGVNTYSAQTLTEFNFDEGNGDKVTSKDGKLVGTFVGPPTFSTDTPSGLKGDYSLKFEAGQRVEVDDANTLLALDQADPSFTVQAWVKFDAQPGGRSVYFFNNAPGGAVSASVTQDRRVFVTTLGVLDQTSTAFIPNDGGWHHIAVVHQNGVEFRFYVDGIVSATVAYTRGVIFTRTNLIFYFGSEPTGGLQFVGQLDRFRYSSGALAPNELDFWPVPGVAPAPPTLAVETAVKLSWPTLPPGYLLQTTADLNGTPTWTSLTNAPIRENRKFNLYFPVTQQKTFYRLTQ